jgi:RimJ/RimL family protein N-acetyltransferase
MPTTAAITVPYRIATARVVMRCWEPEDTPALRRLIAENLEHLRPWIPWIEDEPRPLEEKLREVRGWRAAFDMDQSWYYAMLEEDGKTLAGGMVMNPFGADTVELGAWGSAGRLGRGYHSEAAAVMTRVAFDVLGRTRVQGVCEATNERSIAVMRRLGFTHEATPRHLDEGRRIDEQVWSMLADEWPASPAREMTAGARAWDVLGNRLF